MFMWWVLGFAFFSVIAALFYVLVVGFIEDTKKQEEYEYFVKHGRRKNSNSDWTGEGDRG